MRRPPNPCGAESEPAGAKPDPAVLPFPDPALTDDRIRLRRWCDADTPALVRSGSDPVIRRFRGSQPANQTEVRTWLAELEPARERDERLEMAVAEVSTDASVGSITLWSVSHRHRSAQINYWVASAARGRGTAGRALRLLAGWCFEDLNLARLQLFIDPENLASRRTAEVCGFVAEGLLRSHMETDGRRYDSLVYGLLREDLVSTRNCFS
jgi:[ribosomal protein S5]-alanine N-acetyltransferase